MPGDYRDPAWEQYGHDSIIRRMVRERLPMTRDVWIGLNYPFDGPPHPWTSEHEEEVPEPLRDWSKVTRKG
jgi:hypothetical protein